MPGTWPDGGDEPAEDPDGDADAPAAGGPVHPDDRLWRHPSELAWTAPAAGAAEPPPGAAGVDPAARSGRVWSLAVTSGLTGAALAFGVVALVSALTAPSDVDGDRPIALTGTAATTPTGLAAVAESVLPSVVRVEVDGGHGGSGVVVLDDGHVLTSAQVVDGADEVRLVVPGGDAVPGRVVGVDPVSHLALVAADTDHVADVVWTPARFADDPDLDAGDPVVAVGAAHGPGSPSLSLGVVAGVGRRLGTARGTWVHGMIETDAPMATAAAGGPLCDRTGAVVGLIAPDDGEAGYATPIAVARAVAAGLLEDGELPPVWLGIEGGDLAAPEQAVAGITGGGGVAVARVVQGSPAEDAGLRPGDALVAVDGVPVTSMDDLVAALRRYDPGDAATITVQRDGHRVSLDITLAEREG